MDPTTLFENIITREGGDIQWRDQAKTWPAIRINGTTNTLKTGQGWMLMVDTKNVRVSLHLKEDGTRVVNKSDFALGKFVSTVNQLGGMVYVPADTCGITPVFDVHIVPPPGYTLTVAHGGYSSLYTLTSDTKKISIMVDPVLSKYYEGLP
jgi:hypothetical protein